MNNAEFLSIGAGEGEENSISPILSVSVETYKLIISLKLDMQNSVVFSITNLLEQLDCKVELNQDRIETNCFLLNSISFCLFNIRYLGETGILIMFSSGCPVLFSSLFKEIMYLEYNITTTEVKSTLVFPRVKLPVKLLSTDEVESIISNMDEKPCFVTIEKTFSLLHQCKNKELRSKILLSIYNIAADDFVYGKKRSFSSYQLRITVFVVILKYLNEENLIFTEEERIEYNFAKSIKDNTRAKLFHWIKETGLPEVLDSNILKMAQEIIS